MAKKYRPSRQKGKGPELNESHAEDNLKGTAAEEKTEPKPHIGQQQGKKSPRRSTAQRKNEDWQIDAVAVVAVLVVAYWAYIDVINLSEEDWTFLSFEDDVQFSRNEQLLMEQSIFHASTWAFSFSRITEHEPLAWMFKVGIVEFFGFHAMAFRRASLAFHSATSVMLYFLFTEVIRFVSLKDRSNPGASSLLIRLCALSGALVFATHPIGVQLMGWASCFSYTLSMMFHVASVLSYVIPRLNQTQNGWVEASQSDLLLPCVLFLCSTLCKTYSVFTPAAFIFIEIFVLEYDFLESGLAETIALFLRRISFAVVLLIQWVISLQITQTCNADLVMFNWTDRLSLVILTFSNMFKLTIWPVILLPNYTFDVTDLDMQNSQQTKFSMVAIVVVLVTISLCSLDDSTRVFAGLLSWYIAALVPGSNIVRSGYARLGEDRNVYFALPTLGLAIGIMLLQTVKGMTETGLQRAVRMSCLVSMVFVLVFGSSIMDHTQIQMWRNSSTLFFQSSRLAPRDWRIDNWRLVDAFNRKPEPEWAARALVKHRRLLDRELIGPNIRVVKRQLFMTHLVVLTGVEEACKMYFNISSEFDEKSTEDEAWGVVYNNQAICHMFFKSSTPDKVQNLLWRAQSTSKCQDDLSLIRKNLELIAKFPDLEFPAGTQMHLIY